MFSAYTKSEMIARKVVEILKKDSINFSTIS